MLLKGLTLLGLCGIKLCVSDELTDKLICTRGLTDRAIGYGPIGWGFESLRVYHKRVEFSSALFFVVSCYGAHVTFYSVMPFVV